MKVRPSMTAGAPFLLTLSSRNPNNGTLPSTRAWRGPSHRQYLTSPTLKSLHRLLSFPQTQALFQLLRQLRRYSLRASYRCSSQHSFQAWLSLSSVHNCNLDHSCSTSHDAHWHSVDVVQGKDPGHGSKAGHHR